jgi:hypothetical protein
LAGLFYKLTLKLPLNNTFNTITMRFIIGRLNALITNRSAGVVFLITQPQFHAHFLLGIFAKVIASITTNSIAYRADLQAQGVDLSPFIRYDISRIKMKANDILTSSETNTNEAIALGIEINKQVNYRGGQLNRFVSVEYKSDIRRDTSDYLSKNAEQEVSVKLGLDYQKDNTNKQ